LQRAECSGDYKAFLELMIVGRAEASSEALNSAMEGL
jgi:hypothetical protein